MAAAAAASVLPLSLRHSRVYTWMCALVFLVLFTLSHVSASITFENPRDGNGALMIDGKPENIQCKMYNFFGDRSAPHYDGKYLAYPLKISDDCQIETPSGGDNSKAHMPDADKMKDVVGTAAVVFYPSARTHSGCASYSSVIRQFSAKLPFIEKNLGLPPITLALFATFQTETTGQFGSGDLEPMDDYWTYKPDNVNLGIMSFEYTYVLAGYDNLNEGKWAIVHASQDDGPWNGFLYGFFWSVTSLVFRVVLGILAFTGCYELYRHFKVFGFHLSFRVLVYLGSVFTLVVAIIIGAIARRSNGGSGLLYFSWVVEYVCFTVVSLRWLNYVQAVRATPKLLRVVSFVSWGTTLSFAAAMIYFVINLYSISNNTLAIKPNPGLALCTIAFIAQTCMVLLIAIAYMSWLRSARLPASTRVALFRMTLLVFVLYLGWFVYIGAMMMTAFRWTLTVPGYAVKGFLIYIGPIILQAAIILMLRIFARLDDGAQMDEGNKLSGEGGDRGLLGSLIDLFRVPTVIRRLFNRNGSHGDSAAVPTTADGEQPVRYGTRHAAAGFSERMARVFSDTDNSTADSGATGAGGYSGVSVAAGDLDGDVIYSNRPSMAVGTRSYLDGTAANGSSSPYTDAVDHFAQSDKHDDNGEDNDGYITQGGYLGGPGAGAHVYIDEVDDDDKIEQYYPRPSTSSHHGL